MWKMSDNFTSDTRKTLEYNFHKVNRKYSFLDGIYYDHKLCVDHSYASVVIWPMTQHRSIWYSSGSCYIIYNVDAALGIAFTFQLQVWQG